MGDPYCSARARSPAPARKSRSEGPSGAPRVCRLSAMRRCVALAAVRARAAPIGAAARARPSGAGAPAAAPPAPRGALASRPGAPLAPRRRFWSFSRGGAGGGTAGAAAEGAPAASAETQWGAARLGADPAAHAAFIRELAPREAIAAYERGLVQVRAAVRPCARAAAAGARSAGAASAALRKEKRGQCGPSPGARPARRQPAGGALGSGSEQEAARAAAANPLVCGGGGGGSPRAGLSRAPLL